MSFNYSPKIVTNGLVLCLDAANTKSYVSGSTIWTDLSRSGNTGTLTNGPTFSSANGGSIVFDGTNDCVDLGNVLNFSNYNTSGFTISIWVKVNSTIQANKYVFSKLTNGGTDNQFSIIYGYVANTYELYGGVSGGANQNIRINSQISVNDTNWHNLTYSVGTTTIGYLDGVSKFTNTYADLTYVSSTNNNYLATFNNISANFGNLSIANMVLYNRILSATEILQNYNATKTRFGL